MDNELTALQVPHSLEAEQAVLGSILIDSRCVPDIIGIVNPDDFYNKIAELKDSFVEKREAKKNQLSNPSDFSAE